VLEIEEDLDRTKQLIVEEGRAAIEHDDAEAILLGCAGLGPIDKEIQRQLGVPVLDGTACAVKLLESLHSYGVTTAKVRAYLRPEPKELVACPPALVNAYEAVIA